MTKSYTVQQLSPGIPCISMRGKWLYKVGLDVGSKLKLLECKNMIILVKIPDHIVEQENREKEIKKLEKQVRQLKFAEENHKYKLNY